MTDAQPPTYFFLTIKCEFQQTAWPSPVVELEPRIAQDLGRAARVNLFRFARNPISWTGSNHEASTLDDYPDLVKSALIEVVRRVTERVLGVEFLGEVLERFV